MKKSVVVLNESEGYKFGIGERTAVVSESMPIADAEHIQALYPGIYVDVVEATEPTDQVAAPTGPKVIAKAGKSGETTETAK